MENLPVGNNLMDHYGTCGLTFTVNQPVTAIQKRFENVPNVLEYAMQGSGPFTLLGGVEALAWIPTKYANMSIDHPDIEFHMVSGSSASDDGRRIRKAFGIDENMWKQTFHPLVGKESWSMMQMILRPKSRGSIRLRSRDAYAMPVINAGYFTHPNDMKVLVEGAKLALALSETKALKSFDQKFGMFLYQDVKLMSCGQMDIWSVSLDSAQQLSTIIRAQQKWARQQTQNLL
jgi:choline dehydrogenase-like flavoprotein